MFDTAVFHPSTEASLATFVKAPSHAVCLVGPPGAGKGYTAQYLAYQMLDKPSPDAILTITGGTQGIGIEQVREMHKFLRLKKPGAGMLKRAVIIENAGLMSDEAQNALLKVLEEPPADTVFILTSDGSTSLRPTIYSRTQKIHILPITREQARHTFAKPAKEIDKNYYLSGGFSGLLHALINDEDHKLASAVEQAKQIMQAKPFERLTLIDELTKQKDYLPTLFYALQRVIGAILQRTSDQNVLKRLTSCSRMVFEAERDLQRNANSKLLLTDLFLHL